MFICRPAWRRLLLGLCILAFALPSNAQVAHEIYNGTVSLSSSSSRPSVRLGGIVDLDAVFDDGMFEAEECRPCAAGSRVRLGARIAGHGKGSRFWEGVLAFESADALEIPQSGATELVLSAPFTFHGQVRLADTRNPKSESVELHQEVHGAGTASVRLSSIVDPATNQRLYFFRDITYQFLPPETDRQ